MHNGAPAHWTKLVTSYLNNYFRNGNWIGFNSNIVTWLARSPYLTSLNFLIWGRLKALVHKEEILDRDHLQDRIIAAFNTVKADEETLQETSNAVIRRAELCFDTLEKISQNYLYEINLLDKYILNFFIPD